MNERHKHNETLLFSAVSFQYPHALDAVTQQELLCVALLPFANVRFWLQRRLDVGLEVQTYFNEIKGFDSSKAYLSFTTLTDPQKSVQQSDVPEHPVTW